MKDVNTERRRQWLAAGAPAAPVPPPVYRRDKSGRPTFRYVPADKTDIRVTFARARRQMGSGILAGR